MKKSILLKKSVLYLFILILVTVLARGQQLLVASRDGTNQETPVKIHTVYMDDSPVSVVDGERLPYAAPTKDGHRFAGWFTATGELYDFSLPVRSGFRLESRWESLEDKEYFEIEFETTAGDQTASVTVTASYGEDAVHVFFDVTDAMITVTNPDIGLRDNVEIIIQAKQTDKHVPEYSFNFLATPDGSHWVRRATGPTNWTEKGAPATYAVRGDNYDYTVELTDKGYRVAAYFAYELLNTTRREALNNVRIAASMRNTNGPLSDWNHYRGHSMMWGFPVTYPVLAEDGRFFTRPYEIPELTAAFAASGACHDDLPLLSNLATVKALGATEVMQLTEGADLFSDRTYRLNYTRIPQELLGLSYLHGSIDGSRGEVTESGYVIIAAPSMRFAGLNYELKKAGYVEILRDEYNFGSAPVGGGPLEELTSYYVKWAEKGEVISFDKWAIVIFAPVDDYYVPEWMTWKAPLIRDFTGYKEIDRQWQGVTGMDVTPGGRIFAGWVSGGNGEPRADNFLVIVYSDDGGETWNDLYIIPSSPVARVNDPEFWARPDGRLAIYYSQGKTGNSFDGKTGVWEILIDNPDDDPEDFVVLSQRRIFDGLLRNRPRALSDGTWIAAPNLFSDDDYTIVYASEDQGETWQERGRAYIPNARNFDETIIVEKEDGSLWMTVRSTMGQIIQSFSYDKGRTWTPASYTGIINPCTRFQILRLASGNLLLINNDHRSSRINMSAFLSFDDGETWSRSLLIDAAQTSYPAVHQSADGRIHVVWDRNRISSESKVLYASFTEEEIIAGGILPSSRIKVVSDISQPVETNDGEYLGDSALYEMTDGYDLAGDRGENPVAVQKGPGSQYVYFSDFHDVDFYAQATITAHSTLNFDAYPKFGFVMRSATRKLFFYVDAASKGSQNVLTGTNVGYVVGTETEWFWNDSVTAPAQIKYTRGETVVLGVARRGDSFRFFVNGNLVFEAKNPQGFSALDSASVGFLTFNTRITITDYFLSTEIETIDEKFDHVNAVNVLYIGDSFVDTYHWLTYADFSGDPADVNIGVSGTRVDYWRTNLSRYVEIYRPEKIVVHIGINDINAKVSGADVGAQLKQLFAAIHQALPETSIYFVSICPSVRHFDKWSETEIANQAVIDYANDHDYVNYIDLASRLIDENGYVRGEYYQDRLHLNAAGYSLWEAAIREALG